MPGMTFATYRLQRSSVFYLAICLFDVQGMSSKRDSIETQGASGSGSSSALGAPSGSSLAKSELCESSEAVCKHLHADVAARSSAWQTPSCQHKLPGTCQPGAISCCSTSACTDRSPKRLCAAQPCAAERAQQGCSARMVLHPDWGMAGACWPQAGPVAEGKVAPFPEHVGDNYNADKEDDEQSSGSSSGSDDAAPAKRWWRHVWDWCFPPMRPYDELCQGLAPSALYVLPISSPVRRWSIYTVKSKAFERLSLILILTNCIFLAMDSNNPDFQYTHTGLVLRIAEWFFLVAFSVEMLLKICALGLIQGASTYLRDPWNIIDSMVVIMGWISLSPEVANVSAMRTVRVLRPLRTITGVEGMRMLVATLLGSLPMLLDVLILNGFLFLIFGTVGLQTFMGMLRYECGTPVPGNTAELSDGTPVITNVTSYRPVPPYGPSDDHFVCGDGRIALPPEGGWFAANGALIKTPLHARRNSISSCCLLGSCQHAQCVDEPVICSWHRLCAVALSNMWAI